jgi:PhnB protein
MKEVTPYLVFDGDCREAMTFYQNCLGGELSVMPFGNGGVETPPGSADRVMHAHLASGTTVLMASDTMPGMPYTAGNSVSLNLGLDSVEEVDRLYQALGQGGQGTMAPHDSFWGARFAMLTDRFGMNWMLNFDQKGAQTP